MSKTKIRPYIYLASPLFNDYERKNNRMIRDMLLDSFNVFLPQEDGLLLHGLIDNGMKIGDAEKSVYQTDIAAMKECDILIAVLDGANIDEGVSFELGYCKALNKVCIGLQTDVRRQLPTGNNPMIGCSCDDIFSDTASLKSWLLNYFSMSQSSIISPL
jgi:nucleoside 2-deoxyribosyltransferase